MSTKPTSAFLLVPPYNFQVSHANGETWVSEWKVQNSGPVKFVWFQGCPVAYAANSIGLSRLNLILGILRIVVKVDHAGSLAGNIIIRSRDLMEV